MLKYYSKGFFMLCALLFNITFYLWTALVATICFPFLLFRNFGFWIAKQWALSALKILKWTVGTTVKIEGNVPKTRVLILSKHQSAWETIFFNTVIYRPAFILKKELTWIPLFGSYLKAAGMIALDRQGTIQTLKNMIKDSKKVIESGRSVILFPEGTRSAPGSKHPYKKGAYLLYKNLNVPVVPVALNSGMFWPRRAINKHKGMITVKFLPPIAPGLSEDKFMSLIEERIETESLKLFNQVEKLNKN